jgi:hypothetical protein
VQQSSPNRRSEQARDCRWGSFSTQFLARGETATGDDFADARREVREVVADYRRVKDRMVHRFVHADGSGYTWTNDKDRARVVWLLHDAKLPDGRSGEAGKVYVVEAE